jgi:hypothetical protein
MRINWQRVACALRARTAADKVAELIKLAANLAARNLARALARIHVEKQALGHLGARAGKGRQRDRAMAILQRKLDRDAERIAVMRTVTVG